MMKRIPIVLFALALSGPAFAADDPASKPAVQSSYGPMSVAAILQALAVGKFEVDLQKDGETVDVNANNHLGFSMQRARLILKGTLLDKRLSYMFQGDAVVSGFLLDTKIGYVVRKCDNATTTLYFGRYLPPFTLVLPRPASHLDAINYPIYLFGVFDRSNGSALSGTKTSAGLQPFASTASGRQVGLTLDQTYLGKWTVDLGLYNGWQRSPTAGTFADDNDWKDFLLHVAYSPRPDWIFAADGWLGFPESLSTAETPAPFNVAGRTSLLEHDTVALGVLEAQVVKGPWKAEGELVASRQTVRTIDDADVRSSKTVVGQGGWLQGGRLFPDLIGKGRNLEGIVRLEWYRPDKDIVNSSDIGRLTVGAHAFLEGLHSQIRLNYLLNFKGVDGLGDFLPDRRSEIWLQLTSEVF